MRKTIPVARRVLGESQELILNMEWVYAKALFLDDSATLDDLREAVTTLEETAGTARRLLGGSHPTTQSIELALQDSRAALRSRERPSTQGRWLRPSTLAFSCSGLALVVAAALFVLGPRE